MGSPASRRAVVSRPDGLGPQPPPAAGAARLRDRLGSRRRRRGARRRRGPRAGRGRLATSRPGVGGGASGHALGQRRRAVVGVHESVDVAPESRGRGGGSGRRHPARRRRRASPEAGVEEVDGPRPRRGGRVGVVDLGPGVVEEGVVGPVVDVELGVLAQAFELLFERAGRVGSEVLVVARPRGRGPAPAASRSRAGRRATGSARRTPRTRRRRRDVAWRAPGRVPRPCRTRRRRPCRPDDRRSTSSTAPDMSRAARSSCERHHLLAGLVGLGHLRPPVQVGRQGHEAVGREPVADVLDVGHEAPPLLDHDDARAAARRRHRQISLVLGSVARKFDHLAHGRRPYTGRTPNVDRPCYQRARSLRVRGSRCRPAPRRRAAPRPAPPRGRSRRGRPPIPTAGHRALSSLPDQGVPQPGRHDPPDPRLDPHRAPPRPGPPRSGPCRRHRGPPPRGRWRRPRRRRRRRWRRRPCRRGERLAGPSRRSSRRRSAVGSDSSASAQRSASSAASPAVRIRAATHHRGPQPGWRSRRRRQAGSTADPSCSARSPSAHAASAASTAGGRPSGTGHVAQPLDGMHRRDANGAGTPIKTAPRHSPPRSRRADRSRHGPNPCSTKPQLIDTWLL